MDLNKVFKVASEAAERAGKYICSNLGKIRKLEFKGERNIVTEVDKVSERLIKTYLQKYYPSFKILAEEFGGDISSEYYWLIDPLDGSNNFSHTFPIFCVSIAFMEAKQPLIGLIYDPLRDELFYALRKRGARLNKRSIRVSKTRSLKRSLVATGFYYEFMKRPDTNIEHFIDFLYSSQGIRRTGAAAIDLAYVGSGRLDGFWELGLNPWDTAAGWLIVKEAGGSVTKLDGSEFDPFFPEIVASNGLIHSKMIKILSKNNHQ